jgi:hypothetical protein
MKEDINLTNMQSGVNLRAFINTLRRVSEQTNDLYTETACDLLANIINASYNEGTISVNEIAVMVEAKVQDTAPRYWRGGPAVD